jgi:hypothetical protein
LYDRYGNNVGRTPSSSNFLIWWDGDVVRELLDSNHIDKYGLSSDTRLLTADGCSSNNGTKSTPCLSGDILGDWREEVIFRTSDNTALRIYTTTTTTNYRLYTLMHDPQYRLSVAWQNVAYNQPPHTGFYLGDGMSTPPTPNIKYPGDATSIAQEEAHQQMPKEFVLEQNYANPFNPTTTIKFALPKSSTVKIVVYDILGRIVTTLVDGNYDAGVHSVVFNATKLASGVYFYSIEAEKFVSVKKLMLLK